MSDDDSQAAGPDNRALADFEKSLAELETLVENLESGDLSLEASLEKFERGVALARDCQNALKTAELRVQQLLDREDGNGDAVAAFDDGDPGE
ncbi:exonuclease VII small subunit [Salinisphaera sp. PC39]|uniref:exodeoxyribonuclease VII small subunit n=1 Tax=Salinisphaera sp. PC39 TaxID=1304156 RepID=UPI003342B08B